MEDNNDMLQEIAETIGSDFTAYIEDGVFRITPPEAGIAIFAALSGHAEQLQEAWDATDELVLKLEEVRAENARYRDHLEHVQTVLEDVGYHEKAAEIDRTLWPVVGVLEDGTEVIFTYDELAEMDIECDYCAQGFTCDCGGAE